MDCPLCKRLVPLQDAQELAVHLVTCHARKRPAFYQADYSGPRPTSRRLKPSDWPFGLYVTDTGKAVYCWCGELLRVSPARGKVVSAFALHLEHAGGAAMHIMACRLGVKE